MSDIVGIDTSQVDTTPKHDVSDIVRVNHHTYGRGAWAYGQADEALSAGEFVFLTESDGGLTLMDTTESASQPQLVGVPDVDIASGSYGWVWVGEGQMEAIVVNAVAAGTVLTTTAAAGQAGTGGDAINSVTNEDAGVTSTRVTVRATGVMRTN